MPKSASTNVKPVPAEKLYELQNARPINSEVPMSPVHKSNLPGSKAQVLSTGPLPGNHTGRTGV